MWVSVFLLKSSWTPIQSGTVRRNYSQCKSVLTETKWQACKLHMTSSVNYHWGAERLDACQPTKETADGLCVESFTSPGALPGPNSSVIILHIWIKPPLSVCWHIKLWLRDCFGIYNPVGYCKAWFLCQHQLQPAAITEPLWMGSHLLWVSCLKAV